MLWTTRSKQVRLSLRTAGQLALAGGALGELPRVEHAFVFMREWCVAEGAILPVDSLRQVLEALCASGHVDKADALLRRARYQGAAGSPAGPSPGKAAGDRIYGCGIKLAAPDVACYNAVLGGLLGASRMAEAGQLLAEMEEEDGVEASPETLALFIASPKGALGVRQTA